MSRRGKRHDEPTLFDLPLDGPAEVSEEPRPSSADRASAETVAPGPTQVAPAAQAEPAAPLRATNERATGAPAWQSEGERSPFGAPAPGGRAPAAGQAAPLSVRLLAGLADLAIHLALAVLLLFGARLLGVPAGLGDWPPIAMFLLTFSFLYTVLPLAFWGQTPGMAWAGVEARAADGQGLTVGQTVRRWLGGLLTVALVGLPVLFALVDGRSLTDRLSDSESFIVA